LSSSLLLLLLFRGMAEEATTSPRNMPFCGVCRLAPSPRRPPFRHSHALSLSLSLSQHEAQNRLLSVLDDPVCPRCHPAHRRAESWLLAGSSVLWYHFSCSVGGLLLFVCFAFSHRAPWAVYRLWGQRMVRARQAEAPIKPSGARASGPTSQPTSLLPLPPLPEAALRFVSHQLVLGRASAQDRAPQGKRRNGRD
jgi:hypothetical protein